MTDIKQFSKMKTVAAINDLSGLGRCSLTAALPVLSALGVQCCPVATAALTSQTGFTAHACTDLSTLLARYSEDWKRNGMQLDAIMTGYIPGPHQMHHIQDFIDSFWRDDMFLLVDPVMGDDGRVYGMFSKQLLVGMRTLSQRASLITPNLTEACLLAGMSIEDTAKALQRADLKQLAASVAHQLQQQAQAAQDVVITGIKDYTQGFIYNYCLTETDEAFDAHTLVPASFSGTGDLFASVVCGCRMHGMHTVDAVQFAAQFLQEAIEDTMASCPIAQLDRNQGIYFERHLYRLTALAQEL